MSKILLGCVLLATLALVQPTAAQPLPATPAVADQAQAQPAELSEFLASLTEGEPLQANEIENHCFPSTWCQDLKAECVDICAPCEVVYAICYHYVCDGTCGCSC